MLEKAEEERGQALGWLWLSGENRGRGFRREIWLDGQDGGDRSSTGGFNAVWAYPLFAIVGDPPRLTIAGEMSGQELIDAHSLALRDRAIQTWRHFGNYHKSSLAAGTQSQPCCQKLLHEEGILLSALPSISSAELEARTSCPPVPAPQDG